MRVCDRRLLSALRSLSRPKLLVPAAFALATALGALAAADTALARGFGSQGFGSQGFRGQVGQVGGPRTLGGQHPMIQRAPFARIRGNNGRDTANNGQSNPTKGGKITDRRNPSGGDDRPPRRPRFPHKPIGPGVIVGIPGGPPGGVLPPSNVTGGGQPSSGPGNQAVRRSGGVPPTGERRFVPDEVVIEVAGAPSIPAVEALARRHRLNRIESLSFRLSGTTMFRWRIADRRTVPAVVRALEADVSILSAQPNYLASLQEAPPPAAAVGMGDPAQYALAKLQMPQAHTLAKGDKVLIAVIDSGIDGAHPELAGMVVDAFDAIGTGDTVHKHGTAIAGAIVAHARLMGIAPGAQILAVRAFAPLRGSSEGTTFAILKGLDWAAARGARIINMSFAGPRDPAVARCLAAAREKGIVLIAAAGNAGPKSPPLYPAADPNVIAVTATDADDKLFHAANRGRHIAVAAPGVDLLLPALDSGYQVTSGTSFAAAEVSGAVALLLERKPDLDPEAVRRILMATARDLGPKGLDPEFGAGLVDAYQAILSLPPGAVGQGTVGAATAPLGTR
jgi:subtilisin family serine protease